MPTLEVRGLKKSIDGHGVLKDVSFGLQDGELAAILGPSGGGKTTLFRCILGELTPEAGKILIDGQEVGQLPTERRGIGVVYQSFALFPHLSVADNVGYGLRARRVPTGVARGRIAEMLDLVPRGEPFSMPQLTDAALALGHRVVAFPIVETWLDIGNFEDLNHALMWFVTGEEL